MYAECIWFSDIRRTRAGREPALPISSLRSARKRAGSFTELNALDVQTLAYFHVDIFWKAWKVLFKGPGIFVSKINRALKSLCTYFAAWTTLCSSGSQTWDVLLCSRNFYFYTFYLICMRVPTMGGLCFSEEMSLSTILFELFLITHNSNRFWIPRTIVHRVWLQITWMRLSIKSFSSRESLQSIGNTLMKI